MKSEEAKSLIESQAWLDELRKTREKAVAKLSSKNLTGDVVDMYEESVLLYDEKIAELEEKLAGWDIKRRKTI